MINAVQYPNNLGYNATNYANSAQKVPYNSGVISNLNGNKHTKLSIFHINDMHGNVDNMAGMIAASDKFDQEMANSGADLLKISAGDNFSGGDDTRNQLVINLLARMGIEVSAVGNHEFDATIGKFYNYLKPDKTKFLAANAQTPENSKFYNNVQKSTIIESNGNKYGLIGLLPFDLATVIGNDDKKMEGIRPENVEKSIETVNEEVKKLQKEGVNKIILVSHIGNDKDKEIVPKLHGIDVVVGGHSHTEVKGIKQGENLFNNADGEPVLIVQAGENAKNVGIVNIEFDENGVPVSLENNLVRVSQDKNVAIDYIKNSVMGPSPEVSVIANCDPLPTNRRITPCAWTNFMCDAMKSETNSDIAFINAANTRKVPKQGTLTERDVMETTPLKNTLLVKNMSEKEVVRAIKDALSMSFSNATGEPGILHASGLSYRANTKGELLELNFVDKNGSKTPIDINNPTDKIYKVCYDSFVSKGTEYPVFVPETSDHKEILQTFDFDKDKLTIDYIKHSNFENLNITDDKRIVILDEKGAALSAVEGKKEIFNKDSVQISPLLRTKIQSQSAINGYSNIA